MNIMATRETVAGQASSGTLRVLAVDDEPPVLDEIVHLLRAMPQVGNVNGVGDAASALRYVHEVLNTGAHLDMVVLDLHMPGLNGLDLARVLSRFNDPPAIVFVTAHDEHAVEAFRLNAVDYLLKPVRPERLAGAVGRVMAAQRVLKAEPPVPHPESRPARMESSDARDLTIPVELGGLTRFVSLGDIWYVEAQGDYARLYCAAGSFLVRTPMRTLEERWGVHGFVRIHRSHIVALRHIEELRLAQGQLTVRAGGQVLTVSRRHCRRVRDLLVRNARLEAQLDLIP